AHKRSTVVSLMSLAREDAGGIKGIHQLACPGLGRADIVDDHIRSQLAVREPDTVHSIRDDAVASSRARRKTRPEHLPRRGDPHGHHIGVPLAHGADDGARHVADHGAAGFDIEIDGEEPAASGLSANDAVECYPWAHGRARHYLR